MATNLLQKPVQKDQFESVSFVNEPYMTHYRLKLLVKSLWKHLQTLANHLETSRPDISKAIDNILDGNEHDLYTIRQRFSYYICNDVAIIHDATNNSIQLMGKNGARFPKIPQCDQNELKKFLNQ